MNDAKISKLGILRYLKYKKTRNSVFLKYHQNKIVKNSCSMVTMHRLELKYILND